MTIGPLSDAESGELLDAMATRDLSADTESRRSEILDKAEGNPLFIEEIAKVLLNQKADEAETTGPSPIANVPDTIEQIFLARLDEVEPRSRRIAQEAAVVGRAFPDDLLWPIRSNGRAGRGLSLRA